jgi:hypothetical protein
MFSTILFSIFFAVSTATAQTACELVSKKGSNAPTGDYKKLLSLRCKAEIAAAEKAIRDASAPQEPAPIGTAAVNSAVTTVTYRDATGVAVEASDRWAKHTEKLADIDRRKSVGVAKAENPTCGWGCMLLNPTPWPVVGYGSGYYGAGSGYYGGSYGPRPTRFHYSQ